MEMFSESLKNLKENEKKSVEKIDRLSDLNLTEEAGPKTLLGKKICFKETSLEQSSTTITENSESSPKGQCKPSFEEFECPMKWLEDDILLLDPLMQEFNSE